MTVEASQVRRSRRIHDKAASQVVQDDEMIDADEYDDQIAQDGDDNDEGYEEITPKKRKRSQTTSGNTAKKAKTKETAFEDLRQDFEEHYLFQALNDAEVSITELATDWVDTYKTHEDGAKKDLINFMLNAVGCFTTIEEHDVNNNESASETVGEIQTFFKRQKMHEFFLMSRKPEHKHLKKNFLQFITQIVVVSDEKGLLYENVISEDDEEEQDDDQQKENIIETLMYWLPALSISSVRALRYISTLALFTIETTLCKTLQKNNASLESFKHQLELEQKKKQTAAVKKRLDKMESTVEDYTRQSTILENFIEDIVNTTFIHRFKDVDHYIRVEAMSALGEWMELCPDLFYNVKFLKYLGWVLSDEHASVRLQVLKTLVRLLKHNSVASGVRQFIERFKGRIVEMALYDVDGWVKTNAITLLTEINKLGFLEDAEVSKLAAMIFVSEDKKVTPLIAGFIKSVQDEKAKELIEANETALELEQDGVKLNLIQCVKLSTLVRILQHAHEDREDQSEYFKVAKLFASMKDYSTDVLIDAIDFYLSESSVFTTMDGDVSEIIQLSNDEKSVLISLIHGFISNLIEKPEGLQEAIVPKLISQIPLIMKKAELNNDLSQFIQIFTLFPLTVFEEQNESTTYKSVFQSLIKFFKNNDLTELKMEFTKLITSLHNVASPTVSEVHSLFKDLTAELRIELSNLLNSDDFEFTEETLTQLYTDYIFKLLLLGLSYDISGVLPLFDGVRQQLLLTLTDHELTDDVQRCIAGVFKLMLSGVSWRLDALLKSNELYDAEKELKVVVDLLDELRDVLVNRECPVEFRAECGVCLMDVLTVMKGFCDEYESSEKTNLTNLGRFKDVELDGFKLSESVVDGLKDVYLWQEAKYAFILDESLEREADEDIAYNSVSVDLENLSAAEREKIGWETEKSLVVYTAKLLRFSQLGMLDKRVVERCSLNVDVLGELYGSVIQSEAK